MKYSKSQIAMFFVALAALFAVMSLGSGTSRGQSSVASKPVEGAPAESRVKPTSMVRDRRVEAAPKSALPSAAFAAAAARNALLRNELNWLFGGRQQRGWYLYTPLIKHLLNTEHDVDSGGFASALASWQTKSGLKPSGVLDEESLYAMVSEWQARRLQDRSSAQPEQLVTASASDFYDNERLDELRQVERETYAAYKRMVAAAATDPSLGLEIAGNGELAAAEKYLKILSSFRTREYQEKLRMEAPQAGRAGLAINSPHFTGRALDLYVGGDPVDTKDANRAIQIQTRVYQWLVRNAEHFGFRPYYYEPWHWEYVR
ncbi:MAG: D-alanyl-D-alanine carboxypeptidase family protein [Pyrinomonadaceae bacterium]